MNHKLWTAVGARVIALSFVLAGAAACGERLSDTSTRAAKPLATSPSAIVIGQVPAETSGNSDTPQTAPIDPRDNWVSKPVEQNAMPVPGQANDHSNLSRTPSQKAETAEVLETVGAAKAANSGEPAKRSQ